MSTEIHRRPRMGIHGAAFVLGGAMLLHAEPVPDPAELPRIPGRTVEEARESFVVREGFRVEIAAAEPLVVDPVAIAFDEDERMFVVEMRGYPEKRDEALGRIKRLEDVDGDGRYDKATVYAEGLRWPTSVVCWDGGVFVAASPYISYFKDTDGDGVAEERRVVFNGFGAGQKRLNMQALVNGLTWGPDGRIHGSTARNGGMVVPAGTVDDGQAQPVNLNGADFSFDPKELDLRRESGTAQFGVAFDDFGRRYLCSNSRHLIAVMYSWPWNGVKGLPHPLVDIPVDGGAAEVFRISKVEPWRVVRTRWRVQGLVGGPVEGGGRAAGYFTSASGLTVYRGDAFPEEYRGNVFVGDVGSNLVHRKVIEFPKDRVQPVARRAKGEEKREFLASPDNWFRPVMCANGPDGALYVVDMCRETIEHPWSLPESIKKHLDLYSGSDRGRIWRVVPEGFERPKARKRSELKGGKLIQQLKTANGWERDVVARRILEEASREKPDAAFHPDVLGFELLTHLDGSPAVKRQALFLASRFGHAIKGWNAAAHALNLDPAVRGAMVTFVDAPLVPMLSGLSADPDPRMRFELALRLLDAEVAVEVELLAALIEVAEGDPWIMRTAVAAAKRHGLFDELVESQEEITTVAALLKIGGGEPGKWAAKAQVFLAKEGGGAEERRAALWLLGRSERTPLPHLWVFVDGRDSDLAKIAAEAIVTRPGLLWNSAVLPRWKKMSPGLRQRFVSKMSAVIILAGVGDGTIRKEELGFHLQRSLRESKDPLVRGRAKELLGEEIKLSREEAAKHYRPALLLNGKAEAGKRIFEQRCAVCHAPKDGRLAIGPDLATLRNKGAPMLLENLIAPDKEVAPQYLLWEIATKDGTSHAGMIGEEAAEGFTVFRVDGSRVTVAREGVERLTNLNRSLMPTGLEAGLSLQEMADLLGFVAGQE